MKYILSLTTCLALSYSLSVVCSESEYDQNFTRYSHDDANGRRHTTFINEGAKKLFSQHPELEPEFVREAANTSTSTSEKKTGAESRPHRTRNEQPTQNSCPQSEPKLTRDQLRAQAPNAYGGYNCRGDHQEKDSPKSNVYGDYNCRSKQENQLNEESRWLFGELLTMSKNEEKRKAATTAANTETVNDRATHNSAPETTPAKSIKRRQKNREVIPGESSDSDYDSDTGDPLSYKTVDLSKATCWRCFSHILHSWISKPKES